MDIKSKEARSRNMSKVRAKNTKPELFIRSVLHKKGYRFRVNSSLVAGHPDIYFTKKRIAVFIHGCYWHRHNGCKFAYTPKSNTGFWQKKFSDNIERDKTASRLLANENVRVLIIWECTIKRMMMDDSTRQTCLRQIEDFINGPFPQFAEI